MLTIDEYFEVLAAELVEDFQNDHRLWLHYPSSDMIAKAIKLALNHPEDRTAALDRIFTTYKLAPEHLSLKQRIAYYQLANQGRER